MLSGNATVKKTGNDGFALFYWTDPSFNVILFWENGNGSKAKALRWRATNIEILKAPAESEYVVVGVRAYPAYALVNIRVGVRGREFIFRK